MNYTRKLNLEQSRRPSKAIEAAVKIVSLPNSFLWIFTIFRPGRKPILKWGTLNRVNCATAERAWLHALGLAYEWRDRYSPDSLLVIRESAQDERRLAA